MAARDVLCDLRYAVYTCQQYFAGDVNVDTEGGSRAGDVYFWAETLME